ncbi:hypothetical protein FA15DRAFT_590775 [Coprinopsis marcescibilis]|uniref:Glycosyl transferase CAP10 domain-containing protein n=1 Tax=Coprinopsis marcescibilis TaxID=230819 RepID=A0A5C3KZL0_COPMA|nr:hypothetical protein FA15DRAFT_590775 [Coprinopsis marcescibilis]
MKLTPIQCSTNNRTNTGGCGVNSEEHVVGVTTQIATNTVFKKALKATDLPRSTTLNRQTDAFGFSILDSTDNPLSGEAVDGTTKSHFYRRDGLLEVNPNGPHPIFELLINAEERWKVKNAKASWTLKDACDEYERRYGRKPPKGFDLWWLYVKMKSVPLPDEYDQINRDTEHFWGVDPRSLEETRREWEGHDHLDCITIGKEKPGDPISILNTTFQDIGDKERLMAWIPEFFKLIEGVQVAIPPFRAIFSPHDSSSMFTDHELMTMAIEAAREGRYIDVNNPPEPKWGWVFACAPDSPARVNGAEYTDPIPPMPVLSAMKFNSSYASSASQTPGVPLPKTFIHDHRFSMDPCLHPAHLLMHGSFISHERGPVPHRRLIPQFSFSPTPLHHDIMTAYHGGWIDDIHPRSEDPPFDKKDDHRLQWRGRNTGIYHGTKVQWWRAQRARIVDWANPRSREEMSNTMLLRSTPDSRWKVGEPVDLAILEKKGLLSKSSWAPAMVDAAFAEAPIGCDPEVCTGSLGQDYAFQPWHNQKTQGRYRYIVDVDGNAWSSRFKKLITSNSLIFKSTVYREWFADRVEPWFHFVPIQIDLSDLLDALYFFRGDPSGHGGHPELAKKIAENGRQWSLTHWREADLTAYTFRSLLEYSRVMSTERENGGLDYIYDEEDEVDDEEIKSTNTLTFGEMVKRRREPKYTPFA